MNGWMEAKAGEQRGDRETETHTGSDRGWIIGSIELDWREGSDGWLQRCHLDASRLVPDDDPLSHQTLLPYR